MTFYTRKELEELEDGLKELQNRDMSTSDFGDLLLLVGEIADIEAALKPIGQLLIKYFLIFYTW